MVYTKGDIYTGDAGKVFRYNQSGNEITGKFKIGYT